MSLRVLLVRHAAHALLGRVLTGRTTPVGLSGAGGVQARLLARALAAHGPITEIETSPRLRTRETADAIAAASGAPVAVAPALDEVDFGEFSGRSFDDLAEDERWRRFNEDRASARAPGGESFPETQARIVAHLLKKRASRSSAGTVVLVSHGDVIKAALLHCLGLPLAAFHRIEIDPASFSEVEVGQHGMVVRRLNCTVLA